MQEASNEEKLYRIRIIYLSGSDYRSFDFYSRQWTQKYTT